MKKTREFIRWYQRRALPLFLAVCLAAGAFTFAGVIGVEARAASLTIFHTNDMHGSLSYMGKIAAYKAGAPGSLLVDAGDATQGNAFATLTKGADVITLMNMAGYDAMAAGNHEFDYGLDQFLANVAAANFPILSADIFKDGRPLLSPPYIIKDANGVKVGLFGITTPETTSKTNPSSLPGITFSMTTDDIAAVSRTEIAALKNAGADVVIGLMHLGIDPSSEVTSRSVAAELSGSGLDAIVDGHSHSVDAEYVGGIFIAQTGNGGANLGEMDITLDGSNRVSGITDRLIGLAGSAITPVAAVTDKYNQIKAAQDVLLAPVVGCTASTFWGGTVAGINEARLYETNLGDLVADAMLDAARAYVNTTSYAGLPVVALMNGGGIRTVINPGNITLGDVVNVLPFGNSLAYKVVTPAILYAAIENGVSGLSVQDAVSGKITGTVGGFPQIAGMRFEFDPNAPAGGKVTRIALLNADGTDKSILSRADAATRIVLTANDFEIGGGDSYSMLIGLEDVGEGTVLDQITAGYIQRLTAAGGGSFSYPMTQGRIRTAGAYKPTDYMAFITGTPGDGISYKIDGGAAQTGVFGADGKLAFRVSDGPHTISPAGRADVLVNNYSGAGYYGALVSQVRVTAPASTVKKGCTLRLRAVITPPDAVDQTVTWESSNPDVAAVDMNGLVTGKKTGTVRITAKCPDGASYMFLIMVTA